MSLIGIMVKEQKKMSKWWILVFGVLIFIAISIYDHYQENKAFEEKKQEAITICADQLRGTALDECINKSIKSVEFSKEFNDLSKPLYPISKILTALILGLILFYLIQFIKRIYD
jgi:uncharacterized integral membrane protein